jgi:hemoglobin
MTFLTEVTMKTITVSLLAAGMFLASSLATAADDKDAMPTGAVHTYPGLDSNAYEKFGGKAGVDLWVDNLFKYILADYRVNQVFIQHGKVERQKALNKELEAMVLGGPAKYSGASMSAAHEEMGLTLTQFNAVVEDAYLACDDARIPYHVCNQLIAALAPFERVIVTK